MPYTDGNGESFNVGDVVNVPCTVTATGAAVLGIPVLTLTSLYKDPNGSAVTISTIYTTQTVVKK
jgi:hypothetical protein